jgi:hypothetical protein
LPNFVPKLQITLIFMMMMTCLMSLLVSDEIYLVSVCEFFKFLTFQILD